jgi:hypothetical protein
MHITTEDANDILVRVCLGFWRVFSGGRSKKPGHLRLSGHCSRPRVPCDRKPRSNSALLIVRAITGLGSGLGITTTAEGVETVHQFEQMRLEGCTEVQGYFISSPRPAAEISSMCSILDASVSLRSATRQEPSRRVA